MCCSDPALSKHANTAKCLGVGILIFGIITLLGFGIPPYVGAIGGLVAVIGSSLLICCGPRAGVRFNYGPAIFLLGVATVLHLVGAICWINWYINISKKVMVGDTRAERDAWAECVACADEFDESRGCGAQCSGRSHFVDGDLTTCCELAGVRLGKSVSFALGAGVAGVFLFPSIVFALISSILEAACVIVCCKAMKEPPPRSRISNPPVVVDLPVGCYGAYGQTVVAHAVAQPIVHSVPLAQPSVAATAQPQAVAMAAPAVEYAAPSLEVTNHFWRQNVSGGVRRTLAEVTDHALSTAARQVMHFQVASGGGCPALVW
eukprot:CAMPEP_0119352746 /NCGR_PEP_ID=MMETSP1334-20130426/1984_1 /TAXON_ID=127549 /ORGANISM="Calcidiscus leptoporus, Strain RCC1130" /LENGTH=318 /DNA_ID=CAMNT_0007365853 /DNA_START=25 /DNA_END=977 /DNA_ORIENTATION=-